MAVTEQRQLFAPQIESLAEQYAKSMGTQAAKPFTEADITAMAPQVAPQTPLQLRATADATAGLGAYQPYVTAAGTGLGDAATQLTAAQTGLANIAPYAAQTVQDLAGAQQTLGGVQPYIGAAGTGLAGAGTAMTPVSSYITGAAGLTGAGAGTGTGSIAEYMSPYQQQVIDTTLAEFDKQAAMRQQAISDAAIGVGGYGGGREGVMQAEYQTQSDRDRAMIEAQLQQQGFTQAQAARQADLASRLGIGGAQQQYASGLAGLGQAQLGLGGAQQALAAQQGALAQGYLAPGQMMAGVAGQQAGMAGQRAALAQAQLGAGQAEQAMIGRDVGLAGQVGAMDQAYAQAVRDAEREKVRMGLYEPMERLGWLGQGLTGLMGGMGPQYQFQQAPNPNPLAQALGMGLSGASIYKGLTS
tara:strand:- start:993 stop:2234 length:1242 start_codon:yes stop_codon:yes gene_type:complete